MTKVKSRFFEPRIRFLTVKISWKRRKLCAEDWKDRQIWPFSVAGGKPIQISAIVLYKFLFEVSKKEHKTKTTVRPDFERSKLAFFHFRPNTIKN